MARLAAGDQAAVLVLVDAHRDRLVGAIRAHLRELGVGRVAADDLEGMVLDAGFVIAECARGWRAGGAAPWVWARARIRGVVVRWVGQFGPPFDAERHDAAIATRPATDARGAADVLSDLATRDPRVGLLADAVALVGTPRDREVLLEVLLQRGGGDPSAAITVAQDLGLSPAAVRQITHRMRHKLRALAVADPAFAPLLDLPVLEATQPAPERSRG